MDAVCGGCFISDYCRCKKDNIICNKCSCGKTGRDCTTRCSCGCVKSWQEDDAKWAEVGSPNSADILSEPHRAELAKHLSGQAKSTSTSTSIPTPTSTAKSTSSVKSTSKASKQKTTPNRTANTTRRTKVNQEEKYDDDESATPSESESGDSDDGDEYVPAVHSRRSTVPSKTS